MILSLNILFIALLQTTQVLGSADGVAVGLYKNCITNLGMFATHTDLDWIKKCFGQTMTANQ